MAPSRNSRNSRVSFPIKHVTTDAPSFSTPAPPYPSGNSRSSVSEASKTVDLGSQDDKPPQGRSRTVLGELNRKEGGGDEVPSSTSASLSGRARAISAIDDAASAKIQGQDRSTFSHVITPPHSSPIKTRNRLTLRPQTRRDGLEAHKHPNIARSAPPPPSNPPLGEVAPAPLPVGEATSRPYIPKQKVKPLFPVTSGRIPLSSKSKKIPEAPKPIPTLEGPEDGEWDVFGLTWKEADKSADAIREDKEVTDKQEEGGSPVSAASKPNEVSTPPLVKDLPQATAQSHQGIHVAAYPSPVPSPNNEPTDSDKMQGPALERAPQRYPGQVTSASVRPEREPLFLSGLDEEFEVLVSVLKKYDPVNPLSETDAPSRPSTRREYAVSQDSRPGTQQSAPIEGRKSLLSRTPSRVPGLGSEHMGGTRSAPERRSTTSPIKGPHTYGKDTRSFIPPPPAKRSKDDGRAGKKARDKQRAERAVAAAAAAEAAVKETRTPRKRKDSEIRKIRDPISEVRREDAGGRLRFPTYQPDDPFIGHAIRQAGSQVVVPEMVPPIRSFKAPDEAETTLRLSEPAADHGRPVGEALDTDGPRPRMPDKPERNGKSKRRKRRHSHSYHYEDERRSLSPISEHYYRHGPQPTGRSHSKRAASTSGWVDDRGVASASDDELEQPLDLRKRSKRSKRNVAWPIPGLFEPSSPLSHLARTGETWQPLSKHVDPREADYTHQMQRMGLYIGPQVRQSANTTGFHHHRHRRDHHLETPARLKLSRRESARDHVNDYVNKVNEHSKSSRPYRPKPRPVVRRAKDLPGFLVKPIQTVTWEEYNAAYNDERPFPVDQALIQRSMAALRAEYLRSTGKNRAPRSRAEREKMEYRRAASRIEGMEDIEERVDTVTPALRPMTSRDTSEKRPGSAINNRRVPRLNFTARTPSPPLLPARSQKRRVTRLLEPERGYDEDDEHWEATTGRPDPTDAESSGDDERNADTNVAGHRPAPAPSQARLPLPGNLPMLVEPSQNADQNAFDPGLLPASNGTKQAEEVVDFVQQRLGLDFDGFIAGGACADDKIQNDDMASARDGLAVDRHPADADYPSVPSPFASHGESSSIMRQETTGNSRMMNGAAITDHLLEALRQTRAMFTDEPSSDVLAGEAGDKQITKSKFDDARRQRLADRARLKSLQGPIRPGGKTPGKRSAAAPEVTRSESESQAQLLLNFRPRATQLPSRVDLSENQEQDMEQVTATARVIVGPNAQTPGPQPTQSVPRLGLSRSTSGRYLEQEALSIPKQGIDGNGIQASLVHRPFKPPTQTLRARPEVLPSRPSPTTAAIHASDNPADDETPEYPPAQPIHSFTQATTIVPQTHTQVATRTRSRSRLQSLGRVSTTDKDSSPANLPSSDIPPDSEISISSTRYIGGATRSDASSFDLRSSRPAGHTKVPIKLRRKSFSTVLPKAKAGLRIPRMLGQAGGVDSDHASLHRPGRSAPTRQRDESDNEDEHGYEYDKEDPDQRHGYDHVLRAEDGKRDGRRDRPPSTMERNKIGSQRARQPFRPPTLIGQRSEGRGIVKAQGANPPAAGTDCRGATRAGWR